MLAQVVVTQKSFTSRELFRGVNFSIQPGQKIGFIGRNGTGKSTLLHIIDGSDKEFEGEVNLRKGARVASTRQEHHGLESTTVLDYILDEITGYRKLKHIIDTYPEHMGDDPKKLDIFSDALEQFSEQGFYSIETSVERALATYQLPPEVMNRSMMTLSGGQKRFVELIKLEYSQADLMLIDEPTNHMDVEAKDKFINWLRGQSSAMLVVTHDRDVLGEVDTMLELRDGQIYSFAGNYDDYLRQNAHGNASSLSQYEIALATIKNLKEQVNSVRAKKASTGKTPNPFIPLEKRLLKQLKEIESNLEKPSFWIDKDSLKNQQKSVVESYEKHKSKTIRVGRSGKPGSGKTRHVSIPIISVDDLSLGYADTPLFKPITTRICPGDVARITGRNGAGKTTLLKTILATKEHEDQPAKSFSGYIEMAQDLRIATYEQEINPKYLELTLYKAIEQLLRDTGQDLNDMKVMQLMGDYLFQPEVDANQELATMSGGQKARFQLMKLFAASPEMLILDEPTNHLDLPSIEELEETLKAFVGTIIYVSHDSYFAKSLAPTKSIELIKAS
jgi:ATP-binding cassette, subfamily F, member 3